jgi:hypothetical protein
MRRGSTPRAHAQGFVLVSVNQFLADADPSQSRCAPMERNDLIWIDRMLRITAVVVSVLSLPLIVIVSIMASDDGSPGTAWHLIGFVVLAALLSVLPAPDSPVSRWRLAGFALLRLPSYSVAIAGVGSVLWIFGTALMR